MAEPDETRSPDDPHFAGPGQTAPRGRPDNEVITARDFASSFGEDIQNVLDVASWRTDGDLSREYERIQREVRDAVDRETLLQKEIREHIFPRIKRPHAPPNAGKHDADLGLIQRIHGEFLFKGGMEACDGTIQIHDTLPLTIYQIGVTLVSYRGDQGTWSQRLFRRDLQQSFANRLDEVIANLERRGQRSDGDDGLGELAQKAILGYAERAILLRRSTARWLMGHGHPVPYELLTGGHNLELMVEATNTIRAFVEQRPRFVFVAREPRERMLLTIGHALRPMEYAIISTLDEQLERWLHQKRFSIGFDAGLTWDGQPISATEWIPRFIETVAPKIVVGLFRATPVAPAHVFYAHVDHAQEAGHMLLADSMLQEQSGFPLLADMARRVCTIEYADSLAGLTGNAYAAAGVPWRYAPRRSV